MIEHVCMLALYNRIANESLYDACAQLSDTEYRRTREGSFGSIHALLNHILLGDRIWMSRFKGGGSSTPRLDTVLFESFPELRSARIEEDRSIQAFFESIDSTFLQGSLRYRNSEGKDCTDMTEVAVLHFFNHQTHHRGQVHVMISQSGIRPPSLDLHRALNHKRISIRSWLALRNVFPSGF